MKSHLGFLRLFWSMVGGASAIFARARVSAQNGCAALVMLSVLTGFATSGTAQWRIPTPRDTLFVPANSQNMTVSKLFPGSPVQMNLYITGTFGAFPGQFSSGFDGRYTFNVPNWNAPFPLPNPPSFNGTNYQIYLTAQTDGFNENPIQVFENAYQPSHNYTARYQGHGTWFRFRIKDRLNERPDGYYYSQASGGIGIRLAQFTAGIAIKSTDVNFGAINVGTSSQYLDSIASFGIDPLSVDSVWIDGAGAQDFTFISERGTRFTLANEASNSIRVTFSPSAAVASQATLHIHSSNADAPDQNRTIVLHGVGAAPNVHFNTSVLDFGRVRVTYSSTQYVNIFNAGNAPLQIVKVYQDGGAPAGVFTANTPQNFQIPPGPFSVSVIFAPQAQQSYHAWMYFLANDGHIDSVQLLGEGAQPQFAVDIPVLNFGTVRTFDQVVRTDTVRNVGNWTASITHAVLSGPGKSAYTVAPTDSAFLLNAGEVRGFAITFQPKNGTDANLTAQLDFYFDNAAASQHIILNGYEQRPRLAYDTNLVDFGRVKLMNTSSRTVGVSNTSGSSEMFVPSAVVPTDPGFPVFRVSYPQPNRFANGKDSLSLTFQPNIHGPLGAWLHLDATNQRDSIYLFGFGAQALPVFEPPIIDFNVVSSGTSNYFSTRVSDTGDYPLNICDLHISGPDSAYFKIANPPALPFSIPDSGLGTKQLGVYFSTSDHTGRMYFARLEIRYCDGTADTIPLRAQEAAQFVQYSTNPTRTIDFGKVHVGATGFAPVTFINGAAIPLNVGNMWLTPPNSPFGIKDSTTAVPSNGVKSVQASFTPPARGVFIAWHHAKDGDIKEDSVRFIGTGVAAIASLSTKLVDLGTTVMGTTSPAKMLSLTNAGDWPVTATLTKMGDRYHEFTVVMQQGGKVDSVGHDTASLSEVRGYSITFTPQIPKLPDHEADLLFSFDDGTTQMVHLIAKDETDYLVIDSSSIDFGKVRIGKPAATRWVHLINTSPHALVASALQMPAPPFSATPSTAISVRNGDTASVLVSFAPTAIGATNSMLTGQGATFLYGDTVLLSGIGAAPLPKLSVDTLDFGTLPAGHPAIGGVTLANNGNWSLYSRWSLSGPNVADFSPMIPTDTAIAENSATNYAVGYVATTPLQATPRVATITFVDTEDNSSFQLVLIARDRPPLQENIAIGSYAGRPNDKIYASVRLTSAIPDSIGVQHVRGSVTYDPTNVDLLSPILPGALVPAGRWTTLISNQKPGSFDYDLSTTSDTLRGPGSLLRMTFQIHSDATEGAQVPLSNTPAFPATHDVVAQSATGTIVIEGFCGSIPLSSGDPRASFILQNSPNPFGSSAPLTNLSFDVGADGTVVTITIVNAAGAEVLRPLDHITFARGRYSLPINASDLGSGAYFYEFQADGMKPQVKRMIVE